MRLCGMGMRLFRIDSRFLDGLRGGCGFPCHDDRGGTRLVFGQLGVVVDHFLILIRITIRNEPENNISSNILCMCMLIYSMYVHVRVSIINTYMYM